MALVSDKAVLVKVNVTSTVPLAMPPSGVLRVENSAGVLVQSLNLTAPTAPLPSSVPAVPSFADAYTAVVPANLVRPGLRLTASLPNGQPATTVNPRVATGVPLKVVAVPVQLGNTTGQVVANASDYLQARMPVTSVTVQTRAPYVSQRVKTLPTTEAAWSSAFPQLLSELFDLYVLEAGSEKRTHYYGFVPKRSAGVVGIGYISENAAVGFDLPSNPAAVLDTMTHELGHNLSLSHAPCGGASGADPMYPYANAQLGAPGRYVWGYLSDTRTFVDPRRTDLHDLMSYCSGNTLSDYNYRLIQSYLASADTLQVALADEASGPQDLLMVSGQIEAGRVTLTPVKSVWGEPRLPTPGPYVLRITTAQGVVDYPFSARKLDHADSQHFGFTLPHPGQIQSLMVLKDGVALARSQAAGMTLTTPSGRGIVAQAVARPQVQVTEQGGVLKLSWDAARHPYLTVTHVGSQRINLAQDLSGGSASLPITGLQQGGAWEFSLSDGLNSVRVVSPR